MEILKNIQNERMAANFFGVDKHFLHKAMNKIYILLNLSMPLWGIKVRIPRVDSLSMDMKGLVQAWWTSKMTISPNKKDVVHLRKGVRKYVSQHYYQESQVFYFCLLLALLLSFC